MIPTSKRVIEWVDGDDGSEQHVAWTRLAHLQLKPG